MADFKLDPTTGDLIVEGGIQLIDDRYDEMAQRVSLAIGLNLGEWFIDISRGIPWIRNNEEDFSQSLTFILGNKRIDSPRFITATITEYLEEQDFIQSVEATSTFDVKTRSYTYTATIIGNEGEEITITPFETQL